MSTNADRKGRVKGASPRKRKGGRKARLEDGTRAALVAAVLVASAALSSILLIVLKPSTPSGSSLELRAVPPEAPAVAAEPALAPESAPYSAPPSAAPEAQPGGSAPVPAPEQPPPSRVPSPMPNGDRRAPERGPAPVEVPPSALPSAPAALPRRAPPEPPPKTRAALAFVIDDAGNNLAELEPFLRFPGPLTIAVLPGLPHSAEAARRIRAAGKELILHQPMEALGGQNPGPGAIYAGMDRASVRRVLAKNLAEVGPVAGMNNHQGSKVTMDEGIMETVLAFCRENGIYFLDSRTTAESVVPAVAARMGIRIRERDVFVDNIQEKAVMIRFIQDGMRKAEKQGAAVMIGHAWSSELAATLEELYPELVEQGFSLAAISKIMMGAWDDDEGFGY